jgi:hypothetical protein
MSSPSRMTRTLRVLGLRIPTLPFLFETNQMRPLKSGSAEVIRSSSSSTPLRS